MQSKAYARFNETFLRSCAIIGASEFTRKNLVDFTKAGITKDIPDDLLRSAIVLGVAGMDAFFTDRFNEGLGPFLRKKKPHDELIKLIEEAGFGTKEAINAMVNMDRPMRRVGALLRDHLAKYVTTNISTIDKLYIKVGIKKFCDNIQGKARKPRLLKIVDKAVQRRHEIAHKGDKNSRGKNQNITVKQCTKMLTAIQNFVFTAEEILNSAFPVPLPTKSKKINSKEQVSIDIAAP